MVFGAFGIVEPPVHSLGPTGMLQHALAEHADVSGQSIAGESRDQIEARPRPARPRIDGDHQPPDSALAVLLGETGDLGVNRAGDLLGDQPPRVPGEIAEQEGREQREDSEIDQRKLERGGVEKLAERAQPRPRQPAKLENPRKPARPWLASASPARPGRTAHRRGAGWRLHLSRIMYPAPRMVCSSGCAKPLSILERSREMCTSMTLVCGSK